MSFRISSALWDYIHHYASFPQTAVSLQQMIRFGQTPSQGTLYAGSQFLREELPVRLAHRIKELNSLPHGLSDMPSIEKVKHWYAQSFDEIIHLQQPKTVPPEILRGYANSNAEESYLPSSTPNYSMADYIENPSYGMSNQDEIRKDQTKRRVPVDRRYYAKPLPDIVNWPAEIIEYNSRFTKCLETIKERHNPTVTTVAQGILEWKRLRSVKHIGLDIQSWLDRFYMSRIGIRFLIGQHIALNHQPEDPHWVGIICTQSNVHDIIQEAIETARFICEDHYDMFRSPPIQLICPPHLNFAYVPGHLSHIIFELLKNSLRAVVERFGKDGVDGKGTFPPTKVIVVEGDEDITIKISDEGGGIPRSAIPLIWTYMYTTMEAQNYDIDHQSSDFKAPMAGFGYGLPLSRLYARYFGGDLRLISMEKYGTDLYIHLNRLSSSREPLM